MSRKGWDIPKVCVTVNMFKEEDGLTTIIKREIIFPEYTNGEVTIVWQSGKCIY